MAKQVIAGFVDGTQTLKSTGDDIVTHQVRGSAGTRPDAPLIIAHFWGEILIMRLPIVRTLRELDGLYNCVC